MCYEEVKVLLSYLKYCSLNQTYRDKFIFFSLKDKIIFIYIYIKEPDALLHLELIINLLPPLSFCPNSKETSYCYPALSLEFIVIQCRKIAIGIRQRLHLSYQPILYRIIGTALLILLNPIALKKTKTPQSFGHSEWNWVDICMFIMRDK